VSSAVLGEDYKMLKFVQNAGNMERIWIYQSNRELTAEETQKTTEKLEGFTKQWAAHGKQLAARAEVRFNRFIILFLNEALEAASGCSIDSSVRFLKGIENELQIDLFDRMQIAYRKDDKIEAVSRIGFEKLIDEGKINEDIIVFDNTVANSSELVSRWEVPMKNSWHAKVFKLPV